MPYYAWIRRARKEHLAQWNLHVLFETRFALDGALLRVGAPTVRETLGARERATSGGRFPWDDGRIAGSPALATPDAPAWAC